MISKTLVFIITNIILFTEIVTVCLMWVMFLAFGLKDMPFG